MATRLTVLFLLFVAAVVSFQPTASQADEGGPDGEVCATFSDVNASDC